MNVKQLNVNHILKAFSIRETDSKIIQQPMLTNNQIKQYIKVNN
ncbi:hypothetical protein DOY81_007099 [Sarcophaga bullata]|nr:hypothetical protein DOY81_007099 [Sarcophaga bullata]